MSSREDAYRALLAKSLDWGEGHVDFDAAVDGLAPEKRGQRPEGYPHSAWELVEHIRIAQNDILDFCRNAGYEELKWPGDYWPKTQAPPSEEAWKESIVGFRRDRAALKALALDSSIDLTSQIPHGTGQTYLREVVLVLDHTAYHVGQLVAVRRLLGAWTRGG